jgi:esterase/lipase superfamily enzyme
MINNLTNQMAEKIYNHTGASVEVTYINEGRFSIFGSPASVDKASAFLSMGFNHEETAEYSDEDGDFKAAFFMMN